MQSTINNQQSSMTAPADPRGPRQVSRSRPARPPPAPAHLHRGHQARQVPVRVRPRHKVRPRKQKLLQPARHAAQHAHHQRGPVRARLGGRGRSRRGHGRGAGVRWHGRSGGAAGRGGCSRARARPGARWAAGTHCQLHAEAGQIQINTDQSRAEAGEGKAWWHMLHRPPLQHTPHTHTMVYKLVSLARPTPPPRQRRAPPCGLLLRPPVPLHPQLSQLAPDLGLGVLPHCARVEQHEVGRGLGRGGAEAAALQDGVDDLGGRTRAEVR